MKFPSFYLTLIILLLKTSVFSQCPQGYFYYHFGSQSSIDDWNTYWSNCTEIDDDLVIAGTWSGGSDITSLEAFQNLTSVTGDLTIEYNNNLSSLNGLNNLTHIGGNLTIQVNINLLNLNGLSSLSNVGGSIFLYSNHKLDDIDGIAQLNSIPGDFEIYFNNNLIDFPKFNNMESIGGRMRIEDNAKLKNLHGFDSLAFIGGDLNILDNAMIDSLFSLSSLFEINGYLNIARNDELTTLSGLDSLKTINGFLAIGTNIKLTDISGIRNIDPYSILNQSVWQINDLSIIDNNLLSNCAIQLVCAYLDLDDKITEIGWNSEGCNSEIEIINNCNPLPDCTSLTMPLSLSQNVPINTILEWEPSTLATGYFLSIENGSTGQEILSLTDIGNITEFEPPLLPCGSEILVQLLPYNLNGEALNCSEEIFNTEFVEASIMDDDITICGGDQVVLNASGGDFYHWFPEQLLDNPTIQNPLAFPDTSTVFTLIASNLNACADTVEAFVNVVNFECQIDTILNEYANMPGAIYQSVVPEGNYSFLWNGPNNFQAESEDIIDLGAGCYTLSITEQINNCMLDTVFCVEDLTKDLEGVFISQFATIYPLPMKRYFNVSFNKSISENVSISLMTLNGQIIKHVEHDPKTDSMKVFVEDINSGIYIVVIKTLKITIRKLIIIEK